MQINSDFEYCLRNVRKVVKKKEGKEVKRSENKNCERAR